MNQVLVQPESVASQFIVNQESINNFGPSGYSLSTLDYNTTQAASLASWLATMQGNPDDFRYEITVSDIAADKSEIEELIDFLNVGNSLVTVEWLKPGDITETIVQAVVEGYAFNAIPGETQYTFYLSSATTYQYFILDNTTFGILDTSRLGW